MTDDGAHHGQSAEKHRLRSVLRFRRDTHVANLDTLGKMASFRALPHPLRDILRPGTAIAAYHPMDSEADPRPMMEEAMAMGLTTAMPFHADRDAVMIFRRWSPGDALEKGPFGAWQATAGAERVTPDILLCPLLGFDRQGGRLGQGGGHYDRALAAMTSDVLKIGLGWAIQEIDAVPAEPFDIHMDAILTEQEWIVMEKRA